MKLNSTVALTLMLLTLMVGAGLFSGMWGLALGREALKGVTQPDTRPTNNLAKRGANSKHEEFTILREEDIISSARERINGTTKASKTGNSNKAKALETAKAEKSPFPIVSQSQKVAMEINSARKEGDSLVFQVNMRNNGENTVRFLYSFLVATDDQGQELSVSTNGLPSELPSSSDTYSGTISIPLNILEGVETVSLSLTDYPEQKLELAIDDIPVPR